VWLSGRPRPLEQGGSGEPLSLFLARPDPDRLVASPTTLILQTGVAMKVLRSFCGLLVHLVGAALLGRASLLDYRSWGNDTVVAVSAHPDDIGECCSWYAMQIREPEGEAVQHGRCATPEASMGGLVHELRQQGTPVHYIIFTNGDKGETPSSVREQG
jgi:hypothetical protein